MKYVLQGSIQSLGERIRVTAQLIEAASGSHVWSERYDRPLEDIFAIQDEVTEKVAGTLTGWEGAIAEAERAVARGKPPANLQAYDYYLLGIEAKHKETKEDNIRAQELFRKALELDPRFARAYTGLALTYGYEIWLSYTNPGPDPCVTGSPPCRRPWPSIRMTARLTWCWATLTGC